MEPTREAVTSQLDRVLASDTFASAERLSRFLRYVVERTLAGEGDRLKEYVIGTEVFDRGDHYDPRVDAIVRVEAGRLRAKLDDYYQRHGSADPVLIRIPRGSYSAVFEPRDGAAALGRGTGPRPRRQVPVSMTAAAVLAAAIAAWVAWGSGFFGGSVPAARVAVAVLPFAAYSTGAERLAARITDGVTSELARLEHVSVVSHTSAMQFAGTRRPLKEIAQALNAESIVEGSVEADGGRLRIMVRLVDAATDRKYWVEEFEGPVSEAAALQRRIATAAAAAIGQRSRR